MPIAMPNGFAHDTAPLIAAGLRFNRQSSLLLEQGRQVKSSEKKDLSDNASPISAGANLSR
jgi:hypothetical protein